jgi:hypothetical protein
MIARRLNAEGHRTRKGRPYDRRAVQNTVSNPWFAGRVCYRRGTADEQVVDGAHPALIEPAVFDRLQAARRLRDLAKPSDHSTGRPAQNHALAKLARCGRCAERLYARTSTYRRKDGSRARSYVCHGYHFATGTCDAKPIDAEAVDAAVTAGLDTLLVDFDQWLSRIADAHTAERDRLADEVQRAQRDRDAQAERTAKVEARWCDYVVEGDDAKADAVLPMVEQERHRLEAAGRRLTATQDALASTSAETPTDALLDFANALQQAVRGRLDETSSLAEVNGALRELFSEFRIRETTWAGVVDGKWVYEDTSRRAAMVQPVLREDVARTLIRGDEWPWPAVVDVDDPPPLAWLDPERIAQGSQE